MKRKSIHYSPGFADAEFESYNKLRDTFILTLKTWDEKKIVVSFKEAIRILDNDIGDISDFCEVTDNSEFLENALENLYTNLPQKVSFKHYEFMNLDGNPSLKVVASEINIRIL